MSVQKMEIEPNAVEVINDGLKNWEDIMECSIGDVE